MKKKKCKYFRSNDKWPAEWQRGEPGNNNIYPLGRQKKSILYPFTWAAYRHFIASNDANGSGERRLSRGAEEAAELLEARVNL